MKFIEFVKKLNENGLTIGQHKEDSNVLVIGDYTTKNKEGNTKMMLIKSLTEEHINAIQQHGNEFEFEFKHTMELKENLDKGKLNRTITFAKYYEIRCS